MNFWEKFLQAAEQEGFFHWGETFSVIFTLIYLILATRENKWCWFWGILGCSCWAYTAYFDFNLKIDAYLQIYYVLISFLGWYQWQKGTAGEPELKISTISMQQHFLIISGGVLISLVVGYLFKSYTGTASPYIDALTTVFSVITTYMVVQKKLENWLYWIIIDIIYVFLYFSRGGYLFTILFILYVLIAASGYLKWRKIYQTT